MCSDDCIFNVFPSVQKAGFMLLEVAFARDQKERRYVVVLVS